MFQRSCDDITLINCFIIAHLYMKVRRGSILGEMQLLLEELAWSLTTLGYQIHQDKCFSENSVLHHSAFFQASSAQTASLVGVSSLPLPTRRSRLKRSLGGTLHRKDGTFAKGTKPAGNSASSRISGYVTVTTPLPSIQNQPGVNHILSSISTPRPCWMCCWMESVVVKRIEEELAIPGSTVFHSWYHHPCGPRGISGKRTVYKCYHCVIDNGIVPLHMNGCSKWYH